MKWCSDSLSLNYQMDESRLRSPSEPCSSQGQELDEKGQTHIYTKHSTNCFCHIISCTSRGSPVG